MAPQPSLTTQAQQTVLVNKAALKFAAYADLPFLRSLPSEPSSQSEASTSNSGGSNSETRGAVNDAAKAASNRGKRVDSWGVVKRAERIGLNLSTSANRQLPESNTAENENEELEKLRRTMLGKKAAQKSRYVTSTVQQENAPVKGQSKRPFDKTLNEESDSDEEGGRGAAFASRRSKKRKFEPAVVGANNPASAPHEDLNDDTKAQNKDEDLQDLQTANDAGARGARNATSYLDEVISEKNRKKNKKKKKKKKKHE